MLRRGKYPESGPRRKLTYLEIINTKTINLVQFRKTGIEGYAFNGNHKIKPYDPCPQPSSFKSPKFIGLAEERKI